MRRKSIRLWSVLISVFVILAVMPAVVFAGSTNPVKITTQPQDITAQPGESKTMKVVAENATSYQWQRSSDDTTWTSISTSNGNYSGVKTATITIKVSKTTAGFKYRCVAINGSDSATSSAARVMMDQPLDITAQPKNVSGLAGEEKSMTVKATNVASYQWQRSSDGTNWSNIGSTNTNYSGAKTKTLTIAISNTTAGFTYRCVLANSMYNKTSSTASVKMIVPVEITANPQNVSGLSGVEKTMVVKAKNATSYQWQRSSDDGQTWSSISATNSNYSGVKTDKMTVKISTTTAAFIYRCSVKNDTDTVNSDAATVTVIPSVSIATQPKNLTGKSGDEKSFSVKANNAVSYQWQRSSDGQTWSGISASNANYTGVKTNELTVKLSETTAAFSYRCVVRGEADSATSDAVIINLIRKPTIVEQPNSVFGLAGDEMTMSILAENATAYQWQRSADGKSWSSISETNSNYYGAKTDTLTITVSKTTAGYKYRCVARNVAGNSNSAIAEVELDTSRAYVTFDANGGELVIDDVSYQSYTFTAYTDEVISNIPYAQKDERYQLVGWYLDAAGTKEKKVDLETYVVTGNVTLYAKWELKGVILPFVPV